MPHGIRLLDLLRRGQDEQARAMAGERAGEEDLVDGPDRGGDRGERRERGQIEERRDVTALQIEVGEADATADDGGEAAREVDRDGRRPEPAASAAHGDDVARRRGRRLRAGELDERLVQLGRVEWQREEIGGAGLERGTEDVEAAVLCSREEREPRRPGMQLAQQPERLTVPCAELDPRNLAAFLPDHLEQAGMRAVTQHEPEFARGGFEDVRARRFRRAGPDELAATTHVTCLSWNARNPGTRRLERVRLRPDLVVRERTAIGWQRHRYPGGNRVREPRGDDDDELRQRIRVQRAAAATAGYPGRS